MTPDDNLTLHLVDNNELLGQAVGDLILSFKFNISEWESGGGHLKGKIRRQIKFLPRN